jgi:hypothetical protein
MTCIYIGVGPDKYDCKCTARSCLNPSSEAIWCDFRVGTPFELPIGHSGKVYFWAKNTVADNAHNRKMRIELLKHVGISTLSQYSMYRDYMKTESGKFVLSISLCSCHLINGVDIAPDGELIPGFTPRSQSDIRTHNQRIANLTPLRSTRQSGSAIAVRQTYRQQVEEEVFHTK